MNKILKIFLIAGGIFLLVLAGLAGYLYANQDMIKKYMIEKLNEQMQAKITIQEIDIELFRQFPKVSLDLRQVNISDPVSEKRQLLAAQHVFIGFNLYDILSENYTIKLLTLDSGTCNIFIDKKGHHNLAILKPSSTTEKQGNMFLQLNKVELRKMQVNYTDLSSKQAYAGLIHDIELKGSFTNTQEDISCKGKLYIEKCEAGSINLIRNKEVSLDVVLKMNTDKQVFSIQKGELEMDELKLDIEGDIRNQPKSTFVDIHFKARKLSIPALLSLLPVKINELNEYSSTGDIYFTGAVKGNVGNKEHVAIDVDFGVRDGKLKRGATNLDIRKINLTGHFSNGSKRSTETSLLTLKDLSFMLQDDPMKGDLTITNFKDPFVDIHAEGQISAPQLISLLNSKEIKQAEGKVQFTVSLKGKVNDFSDKNKWTNTSASGSFDIDLQHIQVADKMEVPMVKTMLTLRQNDVFIEQFQAKMEQSDITVKGKLLNVVPYLLQEKQQLEAELEYTSDYLDLNHMLLPAAATNKKETTPLQLPERISLQAKLGIKKLVFHNFNASDVSAVMNWKDKRITISALTCQTMSGNLSANGQVENAPDGRFLITSTATLKSININELFRQCENFGQNELTHKHLFGVLNATIDMASVWSPTLDCDLDKLYAFGDIQILNGEIIEYKPLESLSKYVEVSDLRHLKFAELKNKIEIKNKTIFIPMMDVRNNALNMTVSGTHTFDNYLDYKLKLKLSELIRKKRKAELNEFGEEEEDGGKGLYLYLTMKGPIDKLKYDYDKIAVKNKMKQDIKVEKEAVKEVLKKELGIGKDPDIKEKQNDNDDELEFEKE